MLKKETREIDGQGVDVYVDEEGNVVENPTEEQMAEIETPTEPPKDRPEKNYQAELDRKNKELDESRKRLAEYEERERKEKETATEKQKTAEGDEDKSFRSRMKSLGVHEDAISEMINHNHAIARKYAQQATREQMLQTKDATLEGIVARFRSGTESEKRFIAAYETEFREMVRKQDPQYWLNAGFQEHMMGKIILADPSKLAGEKKEKPAKVDDADLPAATTNTPKGSSKESSSHGYTLEQIVDYARKYSLDADDPETRKKIIAQMKLREEVIAKRRKADAEREKEAAARKARY